MQSIKSKWNVQTGFTMAELLIVVAIIAVLVAVGIPIFTTQLEKARDATTVSNLRAAYAEAQMAYLTGTKEGNVLAVNTDTADGGITSIVVGGIKVKSTKSSYDWSGEARDLPWWSDTDTPADPGAKEKTQQLTFYYNHNGKITRVEMKDGS